MNLPTSTDLKLELSQSIPAAADALAVTLPENPDPRSLDLPEGERAVVGRLIAGGVFRGKSREVAGELLGHKKGLRHILAGGLGAADKLSIQALREAGAALVRAARKRRIQHLAILVPDSASWSATEAVEALATGATLALYRFTECKGTAAKKDDDNDTNGPRTVTLVVARLNAAARQALEHATAIADAQNFARTIAYRPGNNVNPPQLARIAQDAARRVGLACRVLTDKQLKRLGMGGLLGVGSGSANPPRLIALEHKPAKSRSAPLLLVGKSITFDTGGISIKPADKMQRMIFDKCGGMAVLGAMCAIARLKLPIHVVGLLSAAENHVSGHAYRPGDVLRMYNGVTVEVTNTDAEGRLVLGDALAWGIEQYKPAAVLDLATLTGGVVVALGKVMAGVMTNHDGLFAELQQAAGAAGEKIWRLPLTDDYKDLMKSEPADIVNSGGREAHPTQGGIFLSYFVKPEVPWAHIDIAGMSDVEKETPLYGKGPTGWGVRTLVEWVEQRTV
ncbi:MAG: leucyl aminopeptidase, partial [Tepidisphaeraceae bacterium]